MTALRTRRLGGLFVLAAAVAAMAAVVAGRGGARTPATAAVACPVSRGVLPGWARGGFSEPRPRVPHVIGRDGRISAILFAPLVAGTAPQDAPKILWVPRVTAGVGLLRIRARRLGTDDAVTRIVPQGPGPSGVALPRPGCWRMRLAWAGGRDQVDLPYAAAPRR